jgi:hypothetical protein
VAVGRATAEAGFVALNKLPLTFFPHGKVTVPFKFGSMLPAKLICADTKTAAAIMKRRVAFIETSKRDLGYKPI